MMAFKCSQHLPCLYVPFDHTLIKASRIQLSNKNFDDLDPALMSNKGVNNLTCFSVPADDRGVNSSGVKNVIVNSQGRYSICVSYSMRLKLEYKNL